MMLDAGNFLADFEEKFKALVTGIRIYKMMPANSELVVSIEGEREFFAVIRAASSANIQMEVGWIFEPAVSKQLSAGCCYLRFQLFDGCVDERLTVLLHDLSSHAP